MVSWPYWVWACVEAIQHGVHHGKTDHFIMAESKTEGWVSTVLLQSMLIKTGRPTNQVLSKKAPPPPKANPWEPDPNTDFKG